VRLEIEGIGAERAVGRQPRLQFAEPLLRQGQIGIVGGRQWHETPAAVVERGVGLA